jgi:Pyruvate/2-oxoacid:ferredoxin oxidoreductase delta subunit
VSDEVYHKLARVLDTLPNGFPATPDGLEIRLLKKVFTPDEADLCCDLKLTPETAEAIAERTGRPLQGLEEKLISMSQRGEIMGIEMGGARVFMMVPWVVGIYEFQIDRMDREFCEMCEEYMATLGPRLAGSEPRLMQIVPIETEIPSGHQAVPYQQVSSIIENGKSFRVGQCICKKERGIMGQPCERPEEVCMAILPVAGAEPIRDFGRAISKEEAFEILRKSEEAGMVHLTSNVENGHTFICNCCGCCCGVLRAINQLDLPGVVNSHYCAEIEEDDCTFCGICMEERCQVGAIEEVDDTYRVIAEKCIGCGLCVTECPTDAIKLVHKSEEERILPPSDANAWNQERARQRGVDFSDYV